MPEWSNGLPLSAKLLVSRSPLSEKAKKGSSLVLTQVQILSLALLLKYNGVIFIKKEQLESILIEDGFGLLIMVLKISKQNHKHFHSQENT